MGTEETGRYIWDMLANLPEHQKIFEAAVITHIDVDHIGGILSCCIDQDLPPGVVFKDYWFNGYHHLTPQSSKGCFESLGGVQGDRLSKWLQSQPWNLSFNGAAICREANAPLKTTELQGGMRITVLGPTLNRLKELKPQWDIEVRKALERKEQKSPPSDLEALGGKQELSLTDINSLRLLSKQRPKRDTRPANGSSIVLLLEYDGKSILLAGDAFPNDIAEGLMQFSPETTAVRLDAFKTPHHCSRGNINDRLLTAIDCSNWLISTDGSRHRHPDDEAIATILKNRSGSGTHLLFNVASDYNAKWSNPSWQSRFDFTAQYGTSDIGLKLDLS
ncbi:hypothetical protein G7007_09330 [Pseudomonas entomophila]|uniref:hypothetical protein n=1 Tax=Pseudomonas entomophila TaxID=312306 RepID=UPI0015E27352|nr:hypothetical protein [Pseudomonas entomophila]MBA1193061.1 hypothetical protein [Pseudomonas entomophila]